MWAVGGAGLVRLAGGGACGISLHLFTYPIFIAQPAVPSLTHSLFCVTFILSRFLLSSLLLLAWVNAPPPPPPAEARSSCHTPLCGALACRRPGTGGHPRDQHPAAITAAHRGGWGGHRRLDGGAENQRGALGGAVSCVGAVRFECRLAPQPPRGARVSSRLLLCLVP